MTALVPSFPPLLKGMAAGPANPFKIACDQARRGVDAGLVAWSAGEDRMRAALVLAPDEPLETAMAAYIASGVGMQNALGTHAPAETAVQLEWSGGLRVNAGYCGRLRCFSSGHDPKAVPDWLVVGVDLTLRLPPDFEPGERPDHTALHLEGCRDIDTVLLLESWARHTLLWINELDSATGRATLNREWEGLAWKLGKSVTVNTGSERHVGTFLGVDENFGMILKTESGDTELIPLSSMIEEE